MRLVNKPFTMAEYEAMREERDVHYWVERFEAMQDLAESLQDQVLEARKLAEEYWLYHQDRMMFYDGTEIDPLPWEVDDEGD